MLAEFRVSNYRSFKDEQVLSLVAGSEESMGKNSVEVGKYRILKTAVVYGANASGKSNLIKAMACMNSVVQDSAGYKPNEEIPVAPFLFDEKTPGEPSTFEVTFFINEIRYQYGFSTTTKKICREWLLAWPKGREQVWFERNCNKQELYIGSSLKGQNKSIWGKVKSNSLFLSTAAQWNHEQLSMVYKWFEDKFDELPDRQLGTRSTDELFFNLKKSEKTQKVHKLAMKIFKNADFGIDDINTEKVNAGNPDFPEDMLEEFKDIWPRNPSYITILSHCGGEYSLPLEEESDGTRRFYSFLGPLLASIAFGHTIFEDELELNMHPLLTRSIVECIRDFKISDSCAQLIFTTHDTTLLDPDLFGRDQVWFTEKDKQGATQLYSLADYKDVRRGEAMQKRYLAGRYGAIPILERFDLVGEKK